MTGSNAFWKLVGGLITLASVALPAYVTVDVWRRGPIPEKRVELQYFAPSNLLHDLAPLETTAKIVVGNKTLGNLYTSRAFITNAGPAPIVPADFIEPLRVRVKAPWSIVAVANGDPSMPAHVRLVWKRLDERAFEAEPLLLNPGDSTSTYVYISSDESAPQASALGKKEDIEWTARVINLREFTQPQNALDRYAARAWGIHVDLSGWSLIFVLSVGGLFQATYLYLLARSKLCERSIPLVIASGALGLAAAESLSTYVFGSLMTDIAGINNWVNIPPIVAHVTLVVCLAVLSSPNGRAAIARVGNGLKESPEDASAGQG